MMDAEGGRVHHLERRARRLVVIVALQNLLVAACLLLTLYAYYAPVLVDDDDNNNIHIHFQSIADISGNTTLEFAEAESSKNMSLGGEKKDKIYIRCIGPYILYMDVCYMSMTSGKEARGMLQLQGNWSKTPLISFSMNSSSEVCTCSVLHNTVYLKVGEASLYLNSTAGFKLKNVTVGLSNLLGVQCRY